MICLSCFMKLSFWATLIVLQIPTDTNQNFLQVEELEMQMAEHLTKQAEEKKKSKAEEEEEAFMKEGKEEEEDRTPQKAQSDAPSSR